MLTWYFKRALKKEKVEGRKVSERIVGVGEIGLSEEEEDELEGGEEESNLTSDLDITQEYRYRAPKYFENVPLRIVTTDTFENGFIST